MRVLVHAVMVHAATTVARCLIAQVERVMLFAVAQPHDPCLQGAVLRPSAALAAAGLETCHRDAQGHAGLTVLALRAVGEQPGAAKPLRHQMRVGIRMDQMAGRGHLRARLTALQIAAGIGCSGIKLHLCKRQVLELGHGRSIKGVQAVSS